MRNHLHGFKAVTFQLLFSPLHAVCVCTLGFPWGAGSTVCVLLTKQAKGMTALNLPGASLPAPNMLG